MYRLERDARIEQISTILTELIEGKDLDDNIVFSLCNLYRVISDKMEDKINISLKGFNNKTAVFNPGNSTIYSSALNIRKWALNNAPDIVEKYGIGNLNVIKCYLELMVLFHELEHGKQFMIANGDVWKETGACLSESYKMLFDIFIKKDTILPHPIKKSKRLVYLSRYVKNEDLYVLERNANVEAFKFLSELSLYRNDREMNVIFTNLFLEFLRIGYLNSSLGSVYETYREVFMRSDYDKLMIPSDMEFTDRLRYGLPVTEEERGKVLKIKGISL